MNFIKLQDAIKDCQNGKEIVITDLYDEVTTDLVKVEVIDNTIYLRLPFTTRGEHAWEETIAEKMYN